MKANIANPIVKHSAGTRAGRGYSLNEIKAAGCQMLDLKRRGIRIDPRRKTVHEANVNTLKAFFSK